MQRRICLPKKEKEGMPIEEEEKKWKMKTNDSEYQR